MKNNRFFYKLVILIFIAIQSVQNDIVSDLEELNSENYAECSIYNVKYDKWYLHADKMSGRQKRIIGINRFQVFSDTKQGVWQFVPTNHTKNSFYLRNKKYSEDLYADTIFGLVFYFYFFFKSFGKLKLILLFLFNF
jgi:hypothetical protein